MLVYTFDDMYMVSTRVSSMESIRHFLPLEYIALEENDLGLIAALIAADVQDPYSVFPDYFDFSTGKDRLTVYGQIIDSYLESRLETK